jgi:hypothetical protein
MRAVEEAVRAVEADQWRRSDPEKSARADDMVTQLESAIAQVEADLAKAREAGNEKKVKDSRRTSLPASPSSTWPAASPPTTPTDADPSLPDTSNDGSLAFPAEPSLPDTSNDGHRISPPSRRYPTR